MTTVAVANVPHYLDHDDAVDELGIALLLGAWLLACEMDAGNDRALDTAIAKTGRHVKPYHRDKRTQVVAPANRRTTGRYRQLTAGWQHNPPRGMSIVDDITNPDAVERLVSIHLPNGKRNRAKSRLFRNVQARMWARYERRVQRKVARWLVDPDLHLVGCTLGGDVNDLRGLNLHPEQVEVVGHGLMRLVSIPAPGYRVVTSGARVVKRGVDGDKRAWDHPILRARIEFVPTKEKP